MSKIYQSSLVLGNVAQIVTGIVKTMAGNDISNSLNGSRITTDVIQALVYQRLSSRLNTPKS